MTAPKTAAGRKRARAKLLETTKPRTVAQLRRELEAIGTRMRYYEGPPREDLELLARLVSFAVGKMKQAPLEEAAVRRLEKVVDALGDVGLPAMPHPGRQTMAVDVDVEGQAELREAMAQRVAATVARDAEGLERRERMRGNVVDLSEYRRIPKGPLQ